MSIFNVTNYDLESFSLETNPKTYFTSGSNGVSGVQYVFSRRNNSIKNELTASNVSFYEDRIDQQSIGRQSGTLENKVKSYFNSIKNLPTNNPYKIIRRLTPSFSDQDHVENDPGVNDKLSAMDIKSTISGTLFPYYRSVMTNAEMSYTNYSCLNFVSSSATPQTALIYPNVNNSLKISNQFTINFHINVRNKYSTTEFRPGTVLHLSSVYAISVVSGTQRDESNLIKSYGLQLQLSASADIAPSLNFSGLPKSDLIWKFDDVLGYNSWHDVTLTWAGKDSTTGQNIYNDATGSLYVDGSLRGTFVVPSSSLTRDYSPRYDPHLVIGNYYEGPGTMSDFFNESMSRAYGIKHISAGLESEYPFSYPTKFNHVGFFELHDINIKNSVSSGSNTTHDTTPESFEEYQFYLSPFFSEESRLRKVNPNLSRTVGGVVITPQYAVTGSTSTPFNVQLSNGVGAHLMNLENHLSDSAGNQTPFILHMSASAGSVPPIYENLSANDYFYSYPLISGSISAANLFIMPCDDGTFQPRSDKVNITNYYVENSSATANVVTNPNLGRQLWDSDPSTPNLEKLIFSEDKLIEKLGGPIPTSGKWNAQIVPTAIQKAIPAWVNYSKTKSDTVSGTDRRYPGAFPLKYSDSDSNQIAIFEISNLFYGNSIMPESFTLTDTSITGSNGKVSLTIKDDGRGGLYRADSRTPHAVFNNVGNIFYNEGIVIIKNPSLYFVGKDSYEISFKGSRNVHVLKVETMAPRGMVNKSNNPTFINELRPSQDQIDDDENFVYISGINYHDDNLNVVARVKLAQPILKREFSKIAFRMKLDF